jgi:hypothetical protein
MNDSAKRTAYAAAANPLQGRIRGAPGDLTLLLAHP